jgi:hypothetical protein
MVINENKLKNLIRNVIKEMALSHKGIHPVGGIKNPEYDITSGQSGYGVERNRFPLNAPEKFEKKLGWILKNYPGCTVHTYMFPSNFDAATFFHNHRYAGGEYSPYESSRIGNMITQDADLLDLDLNLDRNIDITDRIDDIIYEISQELDENDPSVQKLITTIREAKNLVNDEHNGVLIYFGAHSKVQADPPTPYNMMHQVVDISKFRDSNAFIELYEGLAEIETSDEKTGLDKGFFEGRAQSISSYAESIVNLIIQSAGWLNPDTCTIMNDNPTNQGLAGSNDPYDIVRRCLSLKYKEDNDTIEQMMSFGFVDLLCQLLKQFWNMFKGRIILTFSTRF